MASTICFLYYYVTTSLIQIPACMWVLVSRYKFCCVKIFRSWRKYTYLVSHFRLWIFIGRREVSGDLSVGWHEWRSGFWDTCSIWIERGKFRIPWLFWTGFWWNRRWVKAFTLYIPFHSIIVPSSRNTHNFYSSYCSRRRFESDRLCAAVSFVMVSWRKRVYIWR